MDLFISAGKDQMDTLEQKGLILEGTRVNLAGNDLVLITLQDSTLTGFADLAGGGVSRVAVGAPESSPAGKYARECLTSLDLWDQLQPRLVLAKDVRQVLTYVESGNADAGLVYRSDAMTGRGIKVAAPAPPGSHAPIVYPAAVLKASGSRRQAEEFLSFLTGPEAKYLFVEYGFSPAKD